MTIYDLIQQHAREEAAALKWDAVAAILNEKNIRVHDMTLRSSEETLGVLTRAQIDVETLLRSIRSTEFGKAFVDVLVFRGIDWGNPVAKNLLAQLPPQVSAVLTGMNVSYVSLAGQAGYGILTPDQCRDGITDGSKQAALTRCVEAIESARAEYRSADSTPSTILAAAATAIRIAADMIEGG